MKNSDFVSVYLYIAGRWFPVYISFNDKYFFIKLLSRTHYCCFIENEFELYELTDIVSLHHVESFWNEFTRVFPEFEFMNKSDVNGFPVPYFSIFNVSFPYSRLLSFRLTDDF